MGRLTTHALDTAERRPGAGIRLGARAPRRDVRGTAAERVSDEPCDRVPPPVPPSPRSHRRGS